MNNNTSTSLLLSMLGALALIAAACSEDDTPEDERTLTSLTDAEAVALCEATQPSATQLGNITKLVCIAGLDVQGQCTTETVQACIAEAEAAPDACDAGIGERVDCEATVAEFRACSDAIYAAFAGQANLTCEDAESIDLSRPAACAPLEAKCPTFFETGDE